MARTNTATKTKRELVEHIDLDVLKEMGSSQTPLVPGIPGVGADVFATMRSTIADLERKAHGERDAAGETPPVTAAVTTRRKRGGQDGTQRNPQRSTDAMSNIPNAPSFESLRDTARDLGTQRGQGKDTQIKFALKIIEAGYLGALDLDPNKHGTGVRDGQVLAEDYMKAANAAVIFDAKADNVRKLVANLDKCIKLGSNPKWGAGQPLSNVNDLMTFRQSEKKAGKKVDDAFNTLMRYATQQLKSDHLIIDDALKSFVYKREAAMRSAEDVLDGVRKTLTNLKAGKISHCPDLDNSKEVKDAINLLTARLTAIAKAKGAAAGNTAAPAAASQAA